MSTTYQWDTRICGVGHPNFLLFNSLISREDVKQWVEWPWVDGWGDWAQKAYLANGSSSLFNSISFFHVSHSGNHQLLSLFFLLGESGILFLHPSHQRWYAKWKLSWNTCTLHAHFCTFGISLNSQSVLIDKISASELSQMLIKSALLVGTMRKFSKYYNKISF